jgi:pimeloyl-ACP methyl ester carboxylesterase
VPGPAETLPHAGAHPTAGFDQRLNALAYDRVGAGPPLVLIHGIGSSREAWAPVLDRLTAEREVFAVDLPGFGSSSPQRAGFTPTAAGLAAEVAAWLDRLGLDRVHCAGSSLGGWVALELAKLNRVRTVAGVSPAGFWSDRDRARARFQLTLLRRITSALVPASSGEISPRVERLLRPLAVRVLLQSGVVARPWLVPVPHALAAVRYLAMASGWDTTLDAMLDQRFQPPPDGELSVPVTLAWGSKDRLLPPHQRLRARELLPTARVGLLPGCGHLPMWDDPDLVARMLLVASALE